MKKWFYLVNGTRYSHGHNEPLAWLWHVVLSFTTVKCRHLPLLVKTWFDVGDSLT